MKSLLLQTGTPSPFFSEVFVFFFLLVSTRMGFPAFRFFTFSEDVPEARREERSMVS